MSPQNSFFINFHNLCVTKLPYTKLKSESILVLTLLSMACIDIYIIEPAGPCVEELLTMRNETAPPAKQTTIHIPLQVLQRG